MKNYIYNVLMWIDEGGNVFLIPFIQWLFKLPTNGAEGSAHYTISQFCAEQRVQGTQFGCITCRWLTALFKPFFRDNPSYDHCTEALKGVAWTEHSG